MTNPVGASTTLAEFIAASRIEDVPEKVRHEAKRSLLNFFAVALAGATDPVIESAVATLAPFAGAPTSTVIGRSARTDALGAAFLNAISANVFDYDDTHPGTVIHPTAPVAPALFALAETRPLRGADLIHAFILGAEAECRIGNAVSPGHYARGWHITATCGVFGAAVAVAKILGLDARRVRDALGNAASQSCGLVEALGTGAKSLGVGNAARGGLVAALGAAHGIGGPARPLEGIRGFATVTADDPDFGKITDGLGESWEFARNTYKPYPSGVVLHPVTDACLILRRQDGFDVSRIRAILATGHPLLRQRTDRPDVRTGREAQVSLQHTVAAALIDGAAGLAQYSDARVNDPVVKALGAKVGVRDDPFMPVEAARLAITLEDGRVLETLVETAFGSETNPLSDADIEAKLRVLAKQVTGIDAEALIGAVWSLDRAADAGALMAHARP
ncbi:MmgE/PrpD family protein [Aquabacter spiritensis]|uniref:2-methylcitrate dehydratase PrpD n=1 Tax=Aquabacter spiritensis TaxID=933073 RepID=A0A4R3LZL5_9HYPH|nr:MmgE/PrpD family protein [Aquabacter spiritensis]TCT04235.1 2-methylcitrate dehydratase PrpD [Aquabacter spiritensis]